MVGIVSRDSTNVASSLVVIDPACNLAERLVLCHPEVHAQDASIYFHIKDLPDSQLSTSQSNRPDCDLRSQTRELLPQNYVCRCD